LIDFQNTNIKPTLYVCDLKINQVFCQISKILNCEINKQDKTRLDYDYGKEETKTWATVELQPWEKVR